MLVKRHPVSYLSEIIYFTRPMPRELAETIRTLRRDHGLGYEEVMLALCVTEYGLGTNSIFGKALVERAAVELKDADDHTWK